MKRLASIFFLIIAVALAIAFYPRGGSETTEPITAAQAADFYAQENRLEVEEGTVLIQRADQTTDEVDGSTSVVINDTIQVGENGAATLYWFDDSISRLDAGTELTITMADYNPDNISETHVEFEVIRGNVWSKVMNLVDEDSTFEARSGQVAAGVRGTTFNMEVTDDNIVVDAVDHAVLVTQSDESGTVLGSETVVSGKQALVDKFSARIENRPSDKLAGKWFSFNEERDVQDAAEIKARNIERLKKRLGNLSDVENALESAEGAEKAELTVALAKLRIGELVLAIDREGADGKDIELIAREINEVKQLIADMDLSAAKKKELVKEITSELKLVDRIIADVLPDNEGFYRAKDMIRKMTYANLDGEAKKNFNERMAYARLFELHDSLIKGWTLACVQDDLIHEFKLRAKNDPEFRAVLQSFVDDVHAACDNRIDVLRIDSDEVRTGWELSGRIEAIRAESGNDEPVMIQIDPPSLIIDTQPAR